jgi:bifunctional DNA-binding transcriptional regulator/antitoxin component of YhaV-PrlF toxin-antitoxin module
MADRLHLDSGDRVYAIETERGILLTPYDPLFDDALQAFEEVRRQYRNTLRKLAE